MKMFKANGFSLIEILIVMLILMVIVAGVLQVFVDAMRIRQRTDVLLIMQQNARFAISTITNKIQMAGYQAPLDIAMIPDPRCDQLGSIDSYCAIPNRVQTTDGIVVFANSEEKRFLKPFIMSGDSSCVDSSTVCNDPAACISTNSAQICTPSGFDENDFNGQTIMACGPVNSATDQNCDWILPDPAPQAFLSECSLGEAYLCCAARKVQTGPNCSAGCVRNAATGICEGSNVCHEEITINGQFPDFIDTPARCQFLPPVHAIHYQIHEIPSNSNHFYLMARVDTGPWQAVASNIIDMQLCYIYDESCDPAQECRRWKWQGLNFSCQDTGVPASVRNIRRVMIQITARSSKKVQQSEEINENPPCITAAPLPPYIPPELRAGGVWRQYTLCNTVTARNLSFNEISPPTIW